MIKLLSKTASVFIGVSLMGSGPTLAAGFFIDNFNFNPPANSPGVINYTSNGNPAPPTTINGIPFNPPQRILTGRTGTTVFGNSGNVKAFNIPISDSIGGTRNLTVLSTPDTRNRITSRAEVLGGDSGGIFNFTTNNGITSKATLLYDNISGTQSNFLSNIKANGVISVNTSSLSVESATFDLTLMDRGGGMSTVSLTKNEFNPDTGRGLFALSQFTGVDLNDIISVELSVTQTGGVDRNGNIQLDSIEGLEVPEPSLVFASLVAGGASVCLKRRRHHKPD